MPVTNQTRTFGLLTTARAGVTRRTQGIGSQYRSEALNSARLHRALGIDGGNRYAVGNRFQNDYNLYNKYNTAIAVAGEQRTSFNWGNAAAGGATGALSGAALGYQASGSWIGALAGGVLGLFGGGYTAGKS